MNLALLDCVCHTKMMHSGTPRFPLTTFSLGWDLAARFPRFPGVEFQGRKIVKNSPLVDAYRTETAHDEGADSRIILVRFWY